MDEQRPLTLHRLFRNGALEEQIVGMRNNQPALAESIRCEGDAASLPSPGGLLALIRS